jgi:hypothetical protein
MNTESQIEEMFRAGTHYGYSKSRRHPSTAPYIFNTKNGVDIINIEKTFESFQKVIELVDRTRMELKRLVVLYNTTNDKEVKDILKVVIDSGNLTLNDTIERYNFDLNLWSVLRVTMPVGLCNLHCFTFLKEDRIVILGGLKRRVTKNKVQAALEAH